MRVHRRALFGACLSVAVLGCTDRLLVGQDPWAWERVSVSMSGAQANASSFQPESVEEELIAREVSVSRDGRFVVFPSRAAGLTPHATHNQWQVFVRDRSAQTTSLVSVAPTGDGLDVGAFGGVISADGRRVAFIYTGTVLGAPAGKSQAFMRDLAAGTTTPLSVDANGDFGTSNARAPSFSGDGRYVTFTSSAPNITGDARALGLETSFWHIIVRDVQLGTFVVASVTPSGGLATHDSVSSTLSADGRFVAFLSNASDLVAGDTNGVFDVFLRDLRDNVTTRVSVSSTAEQGNDCGSLRAPVVSDDGRYVVFESRASNLVPDDSNNVSDVFLRDVQEGTTTRVSVGASGQGDGASYDASIAVTDDEVFVAFLSSASNLVEDDRNGVADAFVRAMRSGITTRLVSGAAEADGAALQCAMAGDAASVVIASDASTLVSGDTNHVADVFIAVR